MRTIIATLVLLACTAGPGQQLEKAFKSPPDSAKPHTWWHWMDGNVTKEGITADLEAMKRAGIGGAQMFTVAVGIPSGPVGYMSPKWQEMVVHAVKEAGRLGVELCIHNCAGWSSSGGPWIKPEHAMQVLAWSEKKVSGPTRFQDELPAAKPPFVYASVPYYRDIAVFAFPTPKEDAKVTERLNGRTGVSREDGLEPVLTPTSSAIAQGSIVVLTDKMDANGRLTWDVPQGEWTILRIGHTPTGKGNHPAPPEGYGLEVDKLSREALDQHWAGMMGPILAQLGPGAGKALNNSLIDSYEVGSQNWTPKMREEFIRLRGYDPLPFLPAMAGWVIESREVTERFLWDWRRTIADLFAQNYFGYFGELCHEAGLKFSTESYGNGGFDNIQCGGTADIPMGEFWVGGGAMETTKLASSIGHVYGRKVVGAESFTADDNVGRYQVEPYGVKALGDLVFTNGINRYIFHRYAHQPWMNLKPGMTMGPWGMHLERTVTWWNEASAWLQYVARCQFLLQEGKFVADALYYYGESGPSDLPFRPNLRPQLPSGYDYDGCDANTVLHRLSVKNGRLTLPNGMSYRVLVLPETKFMSPAVARKLQVLAAAGATIVGPRPDRSPSLSGFPGCDDEVRALAAQLWGDEGDTAATGRIEHRIGAGRMMSGFTLKEVFQRLSLSPDFSYSSRGAAKLVYIHRRIGAAEVYFVSNQRYQPTKADFSFRVTGLTPELWHPDTGTTELAPVYREQGGRTVVPLRLGPAESVFVVFRKPATGRHLAKITGPGETAEKAPRIRIVLARYESDAEHGADVTDKVAQMVADGQYEIPATNGEFGDPVVNVRKQLRVEYELDGKKMSQTVPENDTVVLVAVPSAPDGGPDCQLSFNGKTVAATLWRPGPFIAQDNKGRSHRLLAKDKARDLEVAGPWRVAFAPGLGAPPTTRLDKLISWPEHPDPGIKYFSGTATYSLDFDVPAAMLTPNRVVELDLGVVKNFARVSLNGKDLGVLWKAPYRLRVSPKAGRNTLVVQVTNLWPNRLIGDEQLAPDVEWNGAQLKDWPAWLRDGQPRPQTGRIGFTTWRFYSKDSPLPPSGLLGPVVLRSAPTVTVSLGK